MLYDIEKFEPKAGEAYLFDTNIWLYLYSPVTQYSYYIKEIFSEFMYKCVGVGAKIYVTSLIVSEFYNTAMRIEYKAHQTDMYKKGFRNGQTLGDDLLGIIKYCILSKAEKLNDNFEDFTGDNFESSYDFNDYYMVQLCKSKGIKIVTNDSDFKFFSDDVDIITLDSNYVESVQIERDFGVSAKPDLRRVSNVNKDTVRCMSIIK